MKHLLMIITAFFSHAASAQSFSENMVGTYESINCLYYSELLITKHDNYLVVDGKRADSDLLAFTEKIRLETKGKKFNCRPGGSYADVQCRVRESNELLESEERGCFIACGPWHLKISIQNLGNQEIGIRFKNDQTESCNFRKL